MNAKETKAKMDRVVETRKLIAKLDRELFGVHQTLRKLQQAMDYENSYSCSIELTEEASRLDSQNEADGFHGKSYEAFKEHLKSVVAGAEAKDE